MKESLLLGLQTLLRLWISMFLFQINKNTFIKYKTVFNNKNDLLMFYIMHIKLMSAEQLQFRCYCSVIDPQAV